MLLFQKNFNKKGNGPSISAKKVNFILNCGDSMAKEGIKISLWTCFIPTCKIHFFPGLLYLQEE